MSTCTIHGYVFSRCGMCVEIEAKELKRERDEAREDAARRYEQVERCFDNARDITVENERLRKAIEDMSEAVNIIFDGPPSHLPGRFVEVENDAGASINVGEWIERDNGYWALRITKLSEPLEVKE